MRKTHFLPWNWLPALAVAGGLGFAHADDTWMPTQHELERYEHIWKAAPFIAATEVTPKGESIAQRFALTGFARLGDSEVIFVFDRKSLSRFSVAKGSPQQGVELIAVAEKDNINELGARIKAEGEVAEITYDASVAAAGEAPAVAGVPVPAAARPATPNRPGMMSGATAAHQAGAPAHLPPQPPGPPSPNVMSGAAGPTGSTSNVMSGAPAPGTQIVPPNGAPRPVRVIRRRPIVTPTEKSPL